MEKLDEHLYDVLIILDFEGTCDEGISPLVTGKNQEIIEFPFIILDIHQQKVVDEFQYYLKPERVTELPPFTTKLTGITNSQVQGGISLAEAIQKLDDYIENQLIKANQRFCLLVDGEWDIRIQLNRECRSKGIPLKDYHRRYFDIRKEFSKHFPKAYYHPAPSLKFMLGYVKSNFEGRHHSGIDDCKSISKYKIHLNLQGKNVVVKLIEKGHKFRDPEIVPDSYDPNQDESVQDFSAFITEENFSVPWLVRLFHFTEEEVLNIYRVPYLGPDTLDWNFIFIVRDYKAQTSMFRRNVYANIYNPRLFQELIDKHDIPSLSCFYLPEKYVFKEKIKFQFSLNLRRIKWTLVQEIGMGYGCAKKHWSYHQPSRSVAWIFHIFKIHYLALQLAKNSQMIDFEEGDEKKKWISDLIHPQYEEFENRVRPAIQQLDKEFKGLLSSTKKQITELDQQVSKQHQPTDHTLLIMSVLENQSNFSQFQHFAGVRLKRHPNHPNLLHLTNDKPYSLMSLESLQECNGLILDEKDSFKIICFPFKTVFDSEETIYPTNKTHLDVMDWKSSLMFENLDGILCTLYFYEKRWYISTLTSPTGDEPIKPKTIHHLLKRKLENEKYKTLKTIEKLFWATFESLGFQLPKGSEDFNFTFMFQSPAFPGPLVSVQTEKLTLIGIRNRQTLMESWDFESVAKSFKWNYVEYWTSLHSKGLNETRNYINRKSPFELSGVMLAHPQTGKRVSILSRPSALLLYSLNNQLSDTNLKKISQELVVLGVQEPIIQHPKFSSTLGDFLVEDSDIYQRHIGKLQELYDSVSHLKKQEFAKAVLKFSKHYQSVLFAMNKNQCPTIAQLLYENSTEPKLISCFFNEEGIQKSDLKKTKQDKQNEKKKKKPNQN